MKRLSLLFIGFFLLVPVLGFAQAPPAEYKNGINWRAYQGQTINVLFSAHPWQEAITPFIPEFEALTGIKVNAGQDAPRRDAGEDPRRVRFRHARL